MKAKEKASLLSHKAEQERSSTVLLIKLLNGENPAGAGLYANWGEVDANLIAWFVQVVSLNEGAVMYGCSRDLTQFHVKIYIDNAPINKWFAGNEDGRDLLEAWLKATCEAMTEGR